MAFADQPHSPDTPHARDAAARAVSTPDARRAASRARVTNGVLAAAVRELRTRRRRIESSPGSDRT